MENVTMEVVQVVVTSLVSLVAMFLMTRLSGKRQIAQMSPFDYVNSVTVGSIAAELATNLEQWYRPLTAIVIYGVVVWLVHLSSCKSIAVRSFFSGRSMILMQNGTIFKENLLRATIDLNEFLAQARIAGYFDPSQIQAAILETNGQISFLPKSTERPASPADFELHPDPAGTWYDLVLDGHLMQDNLKATGRDEKWLTTQLERQGIGQRSEVFYAACDQHGNFFACRGQ